MLQLLHQDSFINVVESARKLLKLIRRKFLRFVLFCAGRRRICNSDICGSVGDGPRDEAQEPANPRLCRRSAAPLVAPADRGNSPANWLVLAPADTPQK